MNKTLMDKFKYIMIQLQLPKMLLAETLMTTYLLVNLSSSVAISLKIPFELWSSKLATYNNLKVLGYIAYAHEDQGKIAPRALKGKFIGYPEGVKGYKV